MGDIVITHMQPHDISDIAKIHFEALSGDFLPSLGVDFLKKVYYPATLMSEYASTYVALVGEKPVGFVTIAHDSNGFAKDIVGRKFYRIAQYALRATFRDPGHLSKSLEVLWSTMTAKPDPIRGEISFIAVDKLFRRRGLGKALVAKALDHLRVHQVPLCRTKTLAENESVINMYEEIGWRVRDHFCLIGREYVTIVSGVIE